MCICEPVCILLLWYGLEKIQNKFKCVHVCLSLKKCKASNSHDSHDECIETSDHNFMWYPKIILIVINHTFSHHLYSLAGQGRHRL